MRITSSAPPIAPLHLPAAAPPAPPPADTFVSVTMLPQDPMISTPEPHQFPAAQMGTRLSGPRLHTQDSIPVAKADSNGNYNYDLSTPQFDQVNTHAVVAGTLLTYEHYMGHSTPWSFKGPLQVNPHAGEGKTAYYSRWDDSINFKQWDSPSLGKVVKTSQSFDVASHETGHAILDGLRPGLMGGKEGSAFHEGFGDSSAILHALQYDSNLEKILAENGGDFSKPSLVTRLAEEFGTAFNKEDANPNNDDHPYYRTALNDFKYKNPSQLPSDSYPPTQPEEVLTSEAHSFSRIWSGAFYSMVGALFHKASQEAPSQLEALKGARDALGAIWGHSLDHLPASNLKFSDVAAGMLKEANTFQDGRYFDALAAVMQDRNLLTAEQIAQLHQPVAALKLEDVQLSSLNEKLGLPADMAWNADKPLAGADGRQVLTFRSPQQVPLDLGLLGRATLEASSGLTLVFDKEGQLVAQTFTPLSPADVSDLQDEARQLAVSGRVAPENQPFAQSSSEGSLFRARLLPQREGLPVFQHLPIWE